MSKPSPTSRSLAECRKRGWIAQVVEKWNPHARVRQDLFGVIDVVVMVPRECSCLACKVGGTCTLPTQRAHILGIQACAGASHAARRDKALAEPRLRAWIEAGGRFEVWSWAKQGPRGKRKRWTLRTEEVKP